MKKTLKENVIEVRNLVAGYGEKTILDGISFDVQRGEILCIIGASGCGKTTLLKHVTGLLEPRGGEILFWGQALGEMSGEERSTLARRIGLAFQGGALFNSMTVGENIALPVEEEGRIDPDLLAALVALKLGLVGLSGYECLMPDELSGGMRKRVGFARAIAIDPEIVFFDEPSAGLDPITSAGLDQVILDIRRLLGATLVVVTHELNSINTISDRVLMLDRGKIIFLGTLPQAQNCRIDRVLQFFEHQADPEIESPLIPESHAPGSDPGKAHTQVKSKEN